MKRILLFLIILFSAISGSGQVNSVATFSGNGTDQVLTGAGLNNSYKSLSGITKDSQGNIYVVDFSANNIRKITPSGVSTVFAGSELGYPGSANGAGTAARFYEPYDIVADADDNLYVTDRRSHTIRKITPTGVVSTIAGDGFSGFLLGGQPVRFNQPQGIDILPNGELIVADRMNRIIRKLTTSGTYIAHYGIANNAGNVDGTLDVAKFWEPMDVKAVSNTEFYVAESAIHKIRKIDLTTNTVSHFAGNGAASSNNGPLLTASFNSPSSIEYDGTNLYVADRSGHTIRKISGGQVTTISGATDSGFANGTTLYARYNTPSALLFVAPNSLYVADWYNRRLRKITLGDFCANATEVTGTSGTQSIGVINEGVPNWNCAVNNRYFDANAKWFVYKPTQNGLLTISTRTAENNTSTNTLLSVYAHSNNICEGLNCYASNDNISETDLRSELVDIEVAYGTNYYIVWSDYYSDDYQNVNFTYQFTPKNCFKPSAMSTTQVNTETTVNLAWQTTSINQVAVQGYVLEIGNPGFVPGTASEIQSKSVTVRNTSFTGLTPNTTYHVYLKSNCGANDFSLWYGPITAITEYTSAALPLSENFDTTATLYDTGFTTAGPSNTLFRTYSSASGRGVSGSANEVLSHSGTKAVFSPFANATTSQASLFTRKVNLLAGSTYTIGYYARINKTSGSSLIGSLFEFVVPNASYTSEASYSFLTSRSVATLNNTYTYMESSFVPTTSGEYRFGLKNNGYYLGTIDDNAQLYLDSFSITSMLSVDDFKKTSIFMYPNPVLDRIALLNPDNLLIKNYVVVDMNGRVIISKPYLDSDNTIDLSKLSKGFYFIQLETEKGILSKKIIKE
ncbi:T9SS type A sorting domain-containing protein [Flavobacterium sp. GCM10027622]|uniref:T9SS type A sorting domain-containing protein n=1 Tax=unclassified Flavobacterium TaxID=196869 RepID=UPI00361665C0